jgi:flavodoxin
MDFQVIYFSKNGNTKKVAESIASEISVKAEAVSNAELEDDTFIFFGSGCYGGKPAKDMIEFIGRNIFEKRMVALFDTSGGGTGKEVLVMEDQLKRMGAVIKGKYSCKGKFLFLAVEDQMMMI